MSITPPPAPCAPPPPPPAAGVLLPPEVQNAPVPTKPIAFWDTEVYPNYFLLKFRRKGERTAYTFELRAGQRFDQQSIDAMRHLFNTHLSVSYNGLGFDRYVMSVVLNGGDVEQAKWVCDQIIVQKVKGWQLNLPEWDPADHIDLIEIVPGDASLKLCAARIHSRSIRDLPYDPNINLTEPQIVEIGTYCENDLDDLEDLWEELQPQIHQREALSKRYGMDLRSKSDPQIAETVLKKRCEMALGHKLYKADIDYDKRFKFEMPAFIRYTLPQLLEVKRLVEQAEFTITRKPSKKRPGEESYSVAMPPELDGLTVKVGATTYKLGIGGLHSQEKRAAHVACNGMTLQERDVRSYYPSLIENSGRWPAALGPEFPVQYGNIKKERYAGKDLQAALEAEGDTTSQRYIDAKVDNEGGKLQLNGTFGKTGSVYSILFAPEMFIQTTLSGQLSLLMLIEWHEMLGISVVSANTDGVVVKCHDDMIPVSDAICQSWEAATGLELEATPYSAIYSRDVNNYFAITTGGKIKRKGAFAKGGIRTNPGADICADAVGEYLAHGTPIEQTIRACEDLRKFLVVTRVNGGGGVKMWGEGPRKGAKVSEMEPVLVANGWVKEGRARWRQGEQLLSAGQAYPLCFPPQRPEYLGKVVRWYYGTNSPGHIEYKNDGSTVGMSYGAKPCMVMPDEFPADIDYQWYIDKATNMLRDVGALALP